MEKAAKAAFSEYNVLQFFAKRLDDTAVPGVADFLIFASLRRLLISASAKDNLRTLFCVMPCTIAFLRFRHGAPLSPRQTPERRYPAYRSPRHKLAYLSSGRLNAGRPDSPDLTGTTAF